MKKIFTSVTTFILACLLIVPTAFATTAPITSFTDLSTSDENFENIYYIYANGWAQGSQNQINPNNNITKAEIVKILDLYKGYKPKDKPSNPWYKEYMDAGVKLEIIKSANNPTNNVTRYEAAMYIYDLFNIDSINCEKIIDSPYADIDDEKLSKLFSLEIINYYDSESLNFQKDTLATRADVFNMLAQADKNKDVFYYLLNPSYAQYQENKYSNSKHMLDIPTDYNESIDNPEDDFSTFMYFVLNEKTQINLNITKNYTGDAYSRINDFARSFYNATVLYPDYVNMFNNIGYEMTFNGEGENQAYGTLTLTPLNSWTVERAYAERARLLDGAYQIVETLYEQGVLTKNMSETQRAYILADYVVNNNTYDFEISETSHYGSRSFVDGKIVCDGYASLLNALLRMDNIESYGCIGAVNDSGHMWNIANLDGHWRMMDATFMDAHKFTETGNAIFVQYDQYFNKKPQDLIDMDAKWGDIRTVDWTPFEILLPEKVNNMKKGL